MVVPYPLNIPLATSKSGDRETEREAIMLIGVTTFGGDGGKSGISQYIISLLREFSLLNSIGQNQIDPHQYEVVTFEKEREIFTQPRSAFRTQTVGSRWQNTLANLLWHQTELPSLCREKGYEVLFLPAGNRRLPAYSPCPTVGTVHDFSSLHVAQKYDTAHLLYIKRVLPALVRRLNAVITISESSKQDIMEYAKVPEERIHVIPNGVNHALYHPQPKQVAKLRIRAKYQIEAPYILYISRIENPGKNHIRLIQAFDQLKQTHKIPHELVLVGSDWDRADEVHAFARESQSANSIRFMGFTPIQDLPDFYNAADAFVFPSLYEGFGLPVLEAMACGVPVAGANTSSIPEAVGDCGLLFDPTDPEAIADSILNIVSDCELSKSLSERGIQRASKFDWRHTAQETLKVLQQTKQNH